jgi:hypothetical protein
MEHSKVVLSYPFDVVLKFGADGLCIFCTLFGNHGQIVNLILIVSLQILQRFSESDSNFWHFIVLVRHNGRTVISVEKRRKFVEAKRSE